MQFGSGSYGKPQDKRTDLLKAIIKLYPAEKDIQKILQIPVTKTQECYLNLKGQVHFYLTWGGLRNSIPFSISKNLSNDANSNFHTWIRRKVKWWFDLKAKPWIGSHEAQNPAHSLNQQLCY